MCLNGELEIVRVSLRLRIIGQNDGEEGEAVKLPGYVEFLNPRSQSSFFRNLSILISFSYQIYPNLHAAILRIFVLEYQFTNYIFY